MKPLSTLKKQALAGQNFEKFLEIQLASKAVRNFRAKEMNLSKVFIQVVYSKKLIPIYRQSSPK